MLSHNAPGTLAHSWTAFQSCCDLHSVPALKGSISCHSQMRMLGLLSTRKKEGLWKVGDFVKIHGGLQLGLATQ